jgi:hypothetical protein
MRKAERQEYVARRAHELALTGRFQNWLAIETELRFVENFPEARQWLDDSFTRRQLDEVCKRARAQKP